jgi:ESF2/ABP1 family protein
METTHIGKKPRLSVEDEDEESPEYESEAASETERKSPVPDTERLPKRRSKVLSKADISDTREAIAKTGVIYLARIPPRLSPTKIRQLLTPYGCAIHRIFLAPESTATYTRRVKSGGSRKKQYTEGWVEFEDKKVAKRVAKMLNAERIGGKKGDLFYDDLWCMKYLPKFKWHHLTEQIGLFFLIRADLAYQNASRAEKLKNEIAQEKRETVAFLRNAERGKMIDNIQRKRQNRPDKQLPEEKKIRRQFTQNSVVQKADSNNSQQNNILQRVFE